MSTLRFLLALACALVLGPWQTVAHAAPVVLEVENEGRDCSETSGDCFITMDFGHDGVGDDEVNVTQNLRRVHAGVDPAGTPVEDRAPGESLAVDARDAKVDHTLISSARRTWEESGGSPLPGALDITINESGVHVYRPGLSATSPQEGVRWRTDKLGFNDQGIGYDHMGPYNDLGSNSTDGFLRQTKGLCHSDTSGACEETHGNVTLLAAEELPAARVGASVGEFSAGIGKAMEKANRTDAVQGSLGRSFQRDAGELRRREPPLQVHDEREPTAPQGAPPQMPAPNGASPPLQARPLSPPVEPSDSRGWVKLAAVGLLAALLVAAAGLYARLRQEKEILTSSKRQAVLEAVRAQPGLRVAVLARTLDIGRNALLHHLDILERARLVKTKREGHTVSVFPAGVQPPPRFDLQSHPVCREVLRALARSPEGLTRTELRQWAPDVAERTLNYNIRRLQEAGLVASRGDGRNSRLLLNAPAPA